MGTEASWGPSLPVLDSVGLTRTSMQPGSWPQTPSGASARREETPTPRDTALASKPGASCDQRFYPVRGQGAKNARPWPA